MECRNIDELMMDFLYQELDADQKAAFRSHVNQCARCGAELASLEQTRRAFRALPELDAPASVTARLLHEAARRAPARQASERRPLWAWMGEVFTFARHPAFAAAASLVIVAGVAGYLARQGKVSERPRPVATAPAESSRTREAVGGVPSAAPAAEAPAPMGRDPSAGLGATGTGGYAAGAPDEGRTGKFAPFEKQKRLPAMQEDAFGVGALDDKAAGGKAMGRAGGGDLVLESERRGEDGAKPFATPPADRPVFPAAPAGTARDDLAGSGGGGGGGAPAATSAPSARDEDDRAARQADGEVKTSTPKPSAGPGGAGAGTQQRSSTPARPQTPPSQEPRTSQAAGPLLDSTYGGSSGQGGGWEPAPSAGEAGEAAGQVPRPGKGSVTETSHAQARKAAAGGDCATANRLASYLSRIDPAYYKRNVLGDPALARCRANQVRAKNPASNNRPDAPADAQPASNETSK